MATITAQELSQAVSNKSAKILTVDLANGLKGKRISTIYFGYRNQIGIDSFEVGKIISEYQHAETVTDGFEKEGNQARRWDAALTERQIKRYKNTLVIITADGRNTFIRAHEENNGAFTCSDSDRFVFFLEE